MKRSWPGQRLWRLGPEAGHRFDEAITQVAELDEFLSTQASDDASWDRDCLSQDGTDFRETRGCQASLDRPAVVGVPNALNQAVCFKVVDQSRDVSGTDIQCQRQVAQGQLVVIRGRQPEEKLHPSLAEPVLLDPPIYQESHPTGSHSHRGQGFHGAQIDVVEGEPHFCDQLSEPSVIEAASLVAR